MKLKVCNNSKTGVYHLVNEDNNHVFQMGVTRTPVELQIGDVVYTTEPKQDKLGYLWVDFQHHYDHSEWK